MVVVGAGGGGARSKLGARGGWRGQSGSVGAARSLVAGRSGLEIGGPSDIDAPYSLCAAYAMAATLDNCNFSRATVWEGAIAEGQTFVYHAGRAPGRQYILEATQLAPIADGRYDFLLASHTIEHVANPLRALREWTRVVKAGGALILVVPHKEGTFDPRRAVTRLGSIVDEERKDTKEGDITDVRDSRG